MTRGSLAILLVLSGCGGKVEPETTTTAHPSSTSAAAVQTGEERYAKECADEPVPPTRIECTGLYSDFKKKTISPDARPYKPGVMLWSDGAIKDRYISIPKGKKIDASNPAEWNFPVGTRVWKQFAIGDKAIETRYFVKTPDGLWSHTTYAWNDAVTAATATNNAIDLTLDDGSPYHIPEFGECEQCHKGRLDRLLGFEQVALGLPTAEGFTLAEVVKAKAIDPVPEQTTVTIPDDGSGMAAQSIGWLHMNCGVCCHNGNEDAQASAQGMVLRLDPTELDGRPATDLKALQTTLNAPVKAATYAGQNRVRIIPGDAADSLLVELIRTRSTNGDKKAQMPPLATRLVDGPDSQAVIDWINAMPKDLMAGGTQ